LVQLIRQSQVNKEAETRHKKVVAAIPCLNTQASIGEVVKRTRAYVDEVIVIDDGSNDLTAFNAQLAGALVLRHDCNKGYGEAIKTCFKAALDSQADILVIIDGDGQHDPDEIPRLLRPIRRNKADLVIGSRFLDNGRSMPPYRKIGIELINALWNVGSSLQVTDTQSGFRAYSKDILEGMNFTEKGMSASIDILEKARRNHSTIVEVPITCSVENNNTTFAKAIKHGVEPPSQSGFALKYPFASFRSCAEKVKFMFHLTTGVIRTVSYYHPRGLLARQTTGPPLKQSPPLSI
jgi:glycosyltransferase involved in cell wall biosynthesis